MQYEKEKAGEERSLTPREDKGIVMGLIGWYGVLG